jgi:hypothetical protein
VDAFSKTVVTCGIELSVETLRVTPRLISQLAGRSMLRPMPHIRLMCPLQRLFIRHVVSLNMESVSGDVTTVVELDVHTDGPA